MSTNHTSGSQTRLTCPRCGEQHISLSHCPTCDHDQSKPAPTVQIRYRLCRHAAHTGRFTGWDLERWDVDLPYSAPRPEGVPANAEKHSGSLEKGVLWTTYYRKAPLSAGGCRLCDNRAPAFTF